VFVVAEAALQSEGKVWHNVAGGGVNISCAAAVETLCKCWLFFVYTGVVNTLLSFRALFPLSRLTYCAYLSHPLIMVVTAFSLDGPLHIHNLLVVSFGIIRTVYFNTCTMYLLILPTKFTINIIKVYIITMFPCITYNSTCFDILCHHQGVTYMLLAKLHKFLRAPIHSKLNCAV
jgi:hypothetical protein